MGWPGLAPGLFPRFRRAYGLALTAGRRCFGRGEYQFTIKRWTIITVTVTRVVERLPRSLQVPAQAPTAEPESDSMSGPGPPPETHWQAHWQPRAQFESLRLPGVTTVPWQVPSLK
jgi:hypothetical protein